MQGGVRSSVHRKGGLCASHSASWVCWAGFEDLRPKAASPRGTPREGSGSLSPRTQLDGTKPDGRQPDGTQPNGTQTDGTRSDGTQPVGTLPDGT